MRLVGDHSYYDAVSNLKIPVAQTLSDRGGHHGVFLRIAAVALTELGLRCGQFRARDQHSRYRLSPCRRRERRADDGQDKDCLGLHHVQLLLMPRTRLRENATLRTDDQSGGRGKIACWL